MLNLGAVPHFLISCTVLHCIAMHTAQSNCIATAKIVHCTALGGKKDEGAQDSAKVHPGDNGSESYTWMDIFKMLMVDGQ